MLIVSRLHAFTALPVDFEPGAYMTGTNLYEVCRNEGSTSCLSYVIGVADLLVWAENTKVCIPSYITARQLVLSFQKAAREMPQNLNLSAALLVRFGIVQSFPCPANSN